MVTKMVFLITSREFWLICLWISNALNHQSRFYKIWQWNLRFRAVNFKCSSSLWTMDPVWHPSYFLIEVVQKFTEFLCIAMACLILSVYVKYLTNLNFYRFKLKVFFWKVHICGFLRRCYMLVLCFTEWLHVNWFYLCHSESMLHWLCF